MFVYQSVTSYLNYGTSLLFQPMIGGLAWPNRGLEDEFPMNQCCFQGLHIEPLKINHEFLVGGLILKNMKVNWDDEIPNIWEHNIHVPVTTNQNNIGYDGFFIIYPILYVWFIMI